MNDSEDKKMFNFQLSIAAFENGEHPDTPPIFGTKLPEDEFLAIKKGMNKAIIDSEEKPEVVYSMVRANVLNNVSRFLKGGL